MVLDGFRIPTCGEPLERIGLVVAWSGRWQCGWRDALLRRAPAPTTGKQPRTRRIADREHAAEIVTNGGDSERRPETSGRGEYDGGDADDDGQVAHGSTRTQPAAEQRVDGRSRRKPRFVSQRQPQGSRFDCELGTCGTALASFAGRRGPDVEGIWKELEKFFDGCFRIEAH